MLQHLQWWASNMLSNICKSRRPSARARPCRVPRVHVGCNDFVMSDVAVIGDEERVSARLHLLLSRCCSSSIDVSKVAQKFMSAWAKGGRLHEPG